MPTEMIEDDFSMGVDKSVSERARDFNGLLNNIESLNDKKRQLWLEIYENAISDRQNAYAMFVKLARIAQEKSSEHAIHGKTMATYIERMSRANDQLVKLAELVADADKGTSIDANEMFDRIRQDSAGKHSKGH